MRATVLHEPGDVRFEERPAPTIITPTDAVIRLSATCVCGSDLWPYRGIQEVTAPIPMGASTAVALARKHAILPRLHIGIPAAILVLASCDCAGSSRASAPHGSASPRPAIATGESSGSPAVAAEDTTPASDPSKGTRMWMTVGARRFAITLTDNAAARALATKLPLTLDMSELNGNEKHANLPDALPANASRPGTIRSGDLMLYGTDTLVVFYATFESSYSYTRLGRVDDPSDLRDVLGRRGVTVVFAND